MPTYIARWRYSAIVDNRAISLAAGDTIDVDPDLAAQINRDSPGVLIESPASEPDPRALDAAPADRQIKGKRRKDREGDPGDQGVMTRDTFGAVKPRGTGQGG